MPARMLRKYCVRVVSARGPRSAQPLSPEFLGWLLGGVTTLEVVLEKCLAMPVGLRPEKPFRLLMFVSFALLLVLIMYMVSWSIGTSTGTSWMTGSRGEERVAHQCYRPTLSGNFTYTLNPCTFEVCFNLRKCPLTRPFTVYVYDYVTSSGHDDTRDQLVTALEQTGSYTSDPGEACLFLGILWNREGEGENSVESLEKKIHSLEYWGENGENHILIELSTDQSPPSSMLEGVSTGNAITAQSIISPTKPFRAGFDILLPPLGTAEGAWMNLLHPLLPLSRETFVHFHGEYCPPEYKIPGAITPETIRGLQRLLQKEKERVDIQLQCQESLTGMSKTAAVEGEWMLCGDQESRLKLCSKSMFSLIPSPGGRTGVSIYTRLIESLMCGSVPVVIGVGVLPFDDVIDWSRAALVIPSARYSDLLHILRSINKNDFHNFRLKGRHLWYTYFSSPLRVVQISVAIVRSRTLHPPPTAPEYVGKQLLYLPAPNHKHIPSPSFPSSFTAYTTSFWNDIPGPLYTYPNLGPHFSTLSEASVAHNVSQSADRRSAIEKTFNDNFLVNIPAQQFTIIILTYKRNKMLIEALAKLKGIPSLNKVVVVWNNEEDPPPELQLPDIGTPIVVRERCRSGT